MTTKFEISHSSTVMAGNYIAEGWRFMTNVTDKVPCIEDDARTKLRAETRAEAVIKAAALGLIKLQSQLVQGPEAFLDR